MGHVEWIEFALVERVPVAGEIVHARDTWQEAGGGGAVAAVQLAKLAGESALFTALGDDELGHRAEEELSSLGVRVHAAYRREPQRRGFVYVDAAGERTITVMGDRMGPRGEDPLPWEDLREADALYFTAGDRAAVERARAAGKLVATARGLEVLAAAGVELDALVSSSTDEGERYDPADLQPPPRLVVRTAGEAGGFWEQADGRSGRYEATPLPGAVRDAYGCGDSFAAALTFGLGEGRSVDDALELAARAGAACITGRGPYEGQLTA